MAKILINSMKKKSKEYVPLRINSHKFECLNER